MCHPPIKKARHPHLHNAMRVSSGGQVWALGWSQKLKPQKIINRLKGCVCLSYYAMESCWAVYLIKHSIFNFQFSITFGRNNFHLMPIPTMISVRAHQLKQIIPVTKKNYPRAFF